MRAYREGLDGVGTTVREKNHSESDKGKVGKRQQYTETKGKKKVCPRIPDESGKGGEVGGRTDA